MSKKKTFFFFEKIYELLLFDFDFPLGLPSPTKMMQNNFFYVFWTILTTFIFFYPNDLMRSPPDPNPWSQLWNWSRMSYLCVFDYSNNFYFFSQMTPWGRPMSPTLTPPSKIYKISDEIHMWTKFWTSTAIYITDIAEKPNLFGEEERRKKKIYSPEKFNKFGHSLSLCLMILVTEMPHEVTASCNGFQ